MTTEDLLVLLAVGGGGYYLYKRNSAITAAGGGLQLPQGIGTLATNVPLIGSGPSAAQTGAAAIGQALSAATGIPGFGQAASEIAGLFGQGRKQADELVQTYQNPLLAQATVIVNAWHQALNSGQATGAVKEQVKQLLTGLVQQFDQIASEPQFNRAGPGGIQTVNNVLNNVWLPNIELEWQQQGVQ